MTNNSENAYTIDISGDQFNNTEEVPCMDAVSPNQTEEASNLKSFILNRLRRQCSKALIGPWTNPQNIDIREVGYVFFHIHFIDYSVHFFIS